MAQPDEPGDPFSQAPLFRELQRVLLSSPGPVNWELARQVGIATAVSEGDGPVPTDADRRSLEDTVRIAELQVAALTGLAAPAELSVVEAIDRTAWLQAAVDSLKGVVEPVAEKIAEAFSSLMPGVAGAEDPGLAQAAAAGADPSAMFSAIGQLSPLLLGAQAGTVLGSVARTALGRYDLAIPRTDDRVAFVIPNIATLERDWSLDPVEFRLWVALREVAHRFAFARPWVREHFIALVDDHASTLEPDADALRQRLEGLDMGDPERMRETLTGEAVFTPALTTEQQLKHERVQAFLAVAEGFADDVTHTLGRKLLGGYGQITEAMRRHREDDERASVFRHLFGIDVTPERLALGRTFCARVADDAGPEALARMWDAPDALPSMPELEEPTLWMSRTV